MQLSPKHRDHYYFWYFAALEDLHVSDVNQNLSLQSLERS